jgi:virulence-associated protein VapD
MKIDFLNPRLFIYPLVISVFFIATFFFGLREFSFLRGENGLIEILTALFYILALKVSIYGIFSRKNFRKSYFVLWLFLSFIFFGEETSWLQHQLNYQTPDKIADMNMQKELNIHNFKWFQGGSILEENGLNQGLATLHTSQNLFRLGFVVYFLFLPIIGYLKQNTWLIRTLKFPYAGRSLLLYIWIPIAISIILAALSEGKTKSFIAETREMHYAFSIFTYLLLMATRTETKTSLNQSPCTRINPKESVRTE